MFVFEYEYHIYLHANYHCLKYYLQNLLLLSLKYFYLQMYQHKVLVCPQMFDHSSQMLQNIIHSVEVPKGFLICQTLSQDINSLGIPNLSKAAEFLLEKASRSNCRLILHKFLVNSLFNESHCFVSDGLIQSCRINIEEISLKYKRMRSLLH